MRSFVGGCFLYSAFKFTGNDNKKALKTYRNCVLGWRIYVVLDFGTKWILKNSKWICIDPKCLFYDVLLEVYETDIGDAVQCSEMNDSKGKVFS